MREIKFRMWHPEKKVMLLGVQDMYDGLGEFQTSTGKMVNAHDVDYTLVDSFGDILDASKEGRVFVMQSTGLKDKSGKEIYEGDVVRNTKSKEVFAIIWDEEMACFKGRDNNIGKVGSVEFGPTTFPLRGELEVIGNVYENPELRF